ncbi:hypothetical protein DFA_08911 [Cavenderia fasciculata]|uniref:Uncharacterized protein n=1 Tax=Cavenderia fasciculata TaxID=261658 RepID=F4Q517_CACFS|nr:uncharacterized protein DFA_08911 [Cavenderia fasciculata]EGG17910.1 hypothetical protein DFA_08911 [Cavenderia fasciculata]|eukprot:XP_004356394.1 hypothetical protein DFA_08911 [Cavenderia fasciculata]
MNKQPSSINISLGEQTPTPTPNGAINPLVWNVTMAEELQAHVDKCDMSFSPKSKLGVVGEYRIQMAPNLNITTMLNQVGETSVYYNWSTKTCAKGQISVHNFGIWNLTTSFACVHKLCGNTHYITCNYFPRGGFPGLFPYNPEGVPLPTTTPTPTNTPTPTTTPAPTTPPKPTSAPVVDPSGQSTDWRNMSTRIKNQRNCGSCYIFSALSNLEIYYKIKTGNDIDLSEQNVLNCYNNGCNGGWPMSALQLMQPVGIAYENDIPYTAVQQANCTNTTEPRFRWTGQYDTTSASKEHFIEALKSGPLIVPLFADAGFQSYRSGIYSCRQQRASVNHGVVLVGYNKPQDYWIIRNSYGSTWGQEGHIYLNATNDNCYMLYFAATYVKI